MKVGTKSVLYGAHCFLIHPVFVFVAWWKLYGFPWDPRLWVAFFVHDLGYWGKPNMDGPEGEKHVEFGARVMNGLFDYWFLNGVDRQYQVKIWYYFCLYHSRFYAKRDKAKPSKLCMADKLAIALEPSWLYLPRVNWSGEIHEYMKDSRAREGKAPLSDQNEWFCRVQKYMKDYVIEHRDGRPDTWTPVRKIAINAEGVWK
jgi:hypothetical protein